MAGKTTGKRSFGSVRRLPSGRYQVRYTGPDGRTYTGRTDQGRPLTFDTGGGRDGAAGKYLARVSADIQAGTWVSPDAPRPAEPESLAAYAERWLASRDDLSPGTRKLYAIHLAKITRPLGATPVTGITKAMVRDWYGRLDKTRPTARAHTYALLRTILNAAVADDVITVNPCQVRKAGSAKRAGRTEPATVEQLAVIVHSMPERYRLMVLLAASCALRFGELAELRRGDIDVRNAVVRIRRGVIRADGKTIVQGPKSEAGKRDVNIPPHLIGDVKAHLRDHVGKGKDALMFPAAAGGHMAPSSLYAVYYPAREAAGRPDLRFHDLRHTGAVMAAISGATIKELMARLGHSTPAAAMIYQHATRERDKAIAAGVSDLMTGGGNVTPITKAPRRRRRTA